MTRRVSSPRKSKGPPRVAPLSLGTEDLIVFSYPSPNAGDLPDAIAKRLTPAQIEVVRALLAGHGRSAIARDRGRSEKTIDRQIEAIHQRLHVSSLSELMALCVRSG